MLIKSLPWHFAEIPVYFTISYSTDVRKGQGKKKQIVHIFLGGLPEFSHSDTAACFSPIGAKPNLIMDLLSMGEKHIIIVGTVYKYHW